MGLDLDLGWRVTLDTVGYVTWVQRSGSLKLVLYKTIQQADVLRGRAYSREQVKRTGVVKLS